MAQATTEIGEEALRKAPRTTTSRKDNPDPMDPIVADKKTPGLNLIPSVMVTIEIPETLDMETIETPSMETIEIPETLDMETIETPSMETIETPSMVIIEMAQRTVTIKTIHMVTVIKDL